MNMTEKIRLSECMCLFTSNTNGITTLFKNIHSHIQHRNTHNTTGNPTDNPDKQLPVRYRRRILQSHR